MNIYVGNLDYKVTEDDLKGVFEECGTVEEVKIVTDKYTQRSKGFGFIVMNNDDEAKAAIDKLNGTTVGDREIAVNEARPKKQY